MIATRRPNNASLPPRAEDAWKNLGGLWRQLAPFRADGGVRFLEEPRPFADRRHLATLIEYGEHPLLAEPDSRGSCRYIQAMQRTEAWYGGVTHTQDPRLPGAWVSFNGRPIRNAEHDDIPYLVLQLYDYDVSAEQARRCTLYAAPAVFSRDVGVYDAAEGLLIEVTPDSVPEVVVALDAMATTIRNILPAPGMQ